MLNADKNLYSASAAAQASGVNESTLRTGHCREHFRTRAEIVKAIKAKAAGKVLREPRYQRRAYEAIDIFRMAVLAEFCRFGMPSDLASERTEDLVIFVRHAPAGQSPAPYLLVGWLAATKWPSRISSTIPVASGFGLAGAKYLGQTRYPESGMIRPVTDQLERPIS